MNGVHHAHSARATAPQGLASWYVPGRADGFGDRLLMFDNAGTPSLELLRFRPELTAIPGFEAALRDRVRRLSSFQHASFPLVRAVQHLEGGDGLALVSEHAPGQRLSELFEQTPRKGLNPRIVTWLLREVTACLAELQSQGADVAHGALTADRIVLSPEGSLRVVEHVLGSALVGLELPSTAVWRSFGVVTNGEDDGAARLDQSTDVAQLAGIALSLLLARRVTLQELQQRLPVLLDEFCELSLAHARHQVSPLREWIERALRADGHGYGSAADAEYDARQLATPHDPRATVSSPQAQLAPALTASSFPEPPGASSADEPQVIVARTNREAPSPRPVGIPMPVISPEAFPTERAPRGSAPRNSAKSSRPVDAKPVDLPRRPETERATDIRRHPAVGGQQATRPVGARPSAAHSAPPRPQRPSEPHPAAAYGPTLQSRTSRPGRPWLMAAMAAAIVLQTGVIGLLLMRDSSAPPFVIDTGRPGDTVLINGQPAGVTPYTVAPGTSLQSVRVVPAAPSGQAQPDVPAANRPAGTSVAPRGRTRVRAAASAPVQPTPPPLEDAVPAPPPGEEQATPESVTSPAD